MEADQLLDLLRRVRDLQFRARTASPTGWNGNGTGSVAVTSPEIGVVIFHEAGTWRPNGRGELRFTNVYRWSLVGPQIVRLEHLRFGLGQPVHLFDVAPESELAWASVSPHHCRDDCYSARLEIQEWGISLRWDIAGPRKREDIEYSYRWQADV
jgi:Family of unknown function (DUF6314)